MSAGAAGSGIEVHQVRPGARPRAGRPGADPHAVAVLLVVDAGVQGFRLSAPGELVRCWLLEADVHDRSARRRWRSPVAEPVVPAVDRGSASVPLQGTG